MLGNQEQTPRVIRFSDRHPIHARNYNAFQRRRFGDLLVEQERVSIELTDSPSPSIQKLGRRMQSCCSSAMICQDETTGEVALHEKRCKVRCCTYCSRVRGKRAFAQLLSVVSKLDSPKFLTVTVQSVEAPLAEVIAHLRESFARLRRSQQWKTKVSGGAYTIEVTWNKKTRKWHPHIHAIIDARYWPQSQLSAAWKIASKGSFIVDIRAGYSKYQTVKYIVAYASKMNDLQKLPNSKIAEYVEETRSLRFLQTFGNCHGVRLQDDDETDEIDHAWKIVTDAEDLASAAEDSDPIALSLLRWLESGKDSDSSAHRELLHHWKACRQAKHAEAVEARRRVRAGPPRFWDR